MITPQKELPQFLGTDGSAADKNSLVPLALDLPCPLQLFIVYCTAMGCKNILLLTPAVLLDSIQNDFPLQGHRVKDQTRFSYCILRK